MYAPAMDTQLQALQSILDRHVPQQQKIKDTDIPVALIQECVARKSGITRTQMLGERRTKDVTEPRHIAIFLACSLTPNSLTRVAIDFKRRDHTSIMHARDSVRRRIESDAAFAQAVEEYRQAVLAVFEDVRHTEIDNAALRDLLYKMAA